LGNLAKLHSLEWVFAIGGRKLGRWKKLSVYGPSVSPHVFRKPFQSHVKTRAGPSRTLPLRPRDHQLGAASDPPRKGSLTPLSRLTPPRLGRLGREGGVLEGSSMGDFVFFVFRERACSSRGVKKVVFRPQNGTMLYQRPQREGAPRGRPAAIAGPHFFFFLKTVLGPL